MPDTESSEEKIDSSDNTTLAGDDSAPSPFWDFVRIFLIAAAVIIPIRLFLFQPFIVTGSSMVPNFEDSDYLVVCEICYRVTSVSRGDVVVLRAPNSRLFFIKRVIGLPGEHIAIENGQLRITNKAHPEGELLRESYLSAGTYTQGNVDLVLGKDEYYVLGDNRSESSDSRVFGAVERRALIGRVIVRAYPFHSLAVFPSFEYGF